MQRSAALVQSRGSADIRSENMRLQGFFVPFADSQVSSTVGIDKKSAALPSYEVLPFGNLLCSLGCEGFSVSEEQLTVDWVV